MDLTFVEPFAYAEELVKARIVKMDADFVRAVSKTGFERALCDLVTIRFLDYAGAIIEVATKVSTRRDFDS
jgi:hypothetical protein